MTRSPAELARQTRKLHRERFWRTAGYQARRPFMRVLCILRRHAHWERETMLIALSTGRSKRCRWCNRLVLKPRYRQVTW